MDVETAVSVVKDFLDGNDSLRKEQFKGEDGLTGHCYVASESVFHLTGGYDKWMVYRIQREGTTHWFLKNRDSKEIVDPTVSQFDSKPNYSNGVKTGFLTEEPSKRTQKVLNAVQ
jgi:hypothetical protein